MSHLSLSEDLQSLLQADTPLSLGAVFDRVEEKGFGLLLVFLSLPSALPVPAAGYSIPFGIMLALLGIQMAAGRRAPVFPQWVRRRTIGPQMATKMFGAAGRIFRWAEYLIRPRFRWIGGAFGRVLMGLLVILMAVLMMIPIPMTNTFPAFVIFLIGLGLSEEDGLFALAACVVGVLAVGLYALLVYLLITEGPEVAGQIKDWIKDLLGLAAEA